MPSADIVAVWGMIALLNVDLSISIPSLYEYLARLGGPHAADAHLLYGLAAAGGNVCCIPALPLFGRLADARSHRCALLLALAIMCGGGLLYGLADGLGAAGPYAVVGARCGRSMSSV
jgi:MFS family permease